jgi:hypothetical protein
VEAAATVTRITAVDYLLMAVYFVAVLGVGGRSAGAPPAPAPSSSTPAARSRRG